MDFNELKKEYAKYEKKYGLPSFKKLDEDFEIHKIDSESEIFLKIVRKVIAEKILHSLGFVEMLMNPMNAPNMYHGYIKSMTLEDKKRLDKIYSSFAELSVDSLEREIDYDEKKEAELIKKFCKKWDGSKSDFREIFKSIKKPNNNSVRKEKTYFG